MSGPVIIRLQNLPLEARSIDIRRFFEGLMIPDGGVHIIGGERGDAFIAFHSDEDARQAMGRDMYPLCNSKIRLFLSSKTEMQNVIASARQAPAPAPKPTSNPLDYLLKSVIQPQQQQTQISSQINANKLSQLTSTITPNILDQLKNINTIFPNLAQQQPVAPKVEEPKPNVSIDQILNILQTHLQPGQQKAAAAPEKPPSPDHSKNNRYNNNQYNSDRSSGEINSYKSNSNQRYDQRTSNSYTTNKYNSESSSSNSYSSRGGRETYGNSSRDNNSNERYPAKYQSNDNQTSGSGHRALDPIIKVRNFNTNCSYKDVRTFLQGIQIEHDGIKLLADFNNQRNGQAFVKLMSITDLKKALCRNKQFYEDKTIVVTQSSEAEFSSATNVYTFGPNNGVNRNTNNPTQNKKPNQVQDTKSQVMNSNATMGENGFFLKIYGLPVEFDESELKTMFNNVNFIRFTTATPTPITSTSINNGVEETTTSLKAKKLCQVETQLDLERALTRQDERVGKSKLQIFQISKQEYDREIAHAEKYANRYNNSNSSSNGGVKKYSNGGGYDSQMSDDLFVHMSGVPLDAGEDDIRGFFQDINLIGNFIVTDSFKNPVGEVCCYFATKQDTERALELNDQLFMDRNVSVKPLKYAEYHMIAQKQLMSRINENRRRALLGDAPDTFAQVLQGRSNSGNSSQNSNESDDESQRFGSKNNGNGPVNLMGLNGNNHKRKNLPDNGNNQMKRIKSNHNEDSNSSPNSQALPPLPPEFSKYRNRLILISNINYDASREDILELVSNFSPLEHTLKIRHDDQGRPAGDAVIAFQESQDADEAVDHLDGSEFMGDSLRATLFSSA